MAINTTHWNSAEYLQTEEDIQLYLEACLEEAGDDSIFIAYALDVTARAKNMNQIRVSNDEKQFKSEALAAVHEAALGLHEAGVLNKVTMKTFNEMCLTPVGFIYCQSH